MSKPIEHGYRDRLRPEGSPMPRCTKCSSIVDQSAKFCANCGNPLLRQGTEPKTAEQPRRCARCQRRLADGFFPARWAKKCQRCSDGELKSSLLHLLAGVIMVGICLITLVAIGASPFFTLRPNDKNAGSERSAIDAQTPLPVACQTKDFTISHARTSLESNLDALTLTGIVTNNCAKPASPKLKWTSYYGNGSVAFSVEFWPAGTANIEPRRRYPFEYLEVSK